MSTIKTFLLIFLTITISKSLAEFTPDDEEITNANFQKFINALLEKTFNNQTKIQINCQGNLVECVVNPHGDAIWTARFNLYSKFIGTNVEESLDKCFTQSGTKEEVQECTELIRGKMYEFLNNEFIADLISIIKCSSLNTECYI